LPTISIIFPAITGHNAGDAGASVSVNITHQVHDPGLLQCEIWLAFKDVFHGQAIGLLVTLSAQRPHSRAFAGVKEANLNKGAIGIAPDFTAKGVYFFDQVSLAGPPMEGLQGMRAMLSRFMVNKAFCSPSGHRPVQLHSPRGRRQPQ